MQYDDEDLDDLQYDPALDDNHVLTPEDIGAPQR